MTDKKSEIEISETTEEEIEQTKKLLKGKHDLVVPQKPLLELIKLMKELAWWLKVTEGDYYYTHITDEKVFDVKKLIKKEYGKDLTQSEADNAARGLMLIVPLKEKQRIADEMRAIMVKYQKVKYAKPILDKTAELFKVNYGFELNEKDLKDIVYFLCKTLWYEEGMDESPERCLDDLLVYIDKRKRGKRTNCLKLHDAIRQSLDWAVKEKLDRKTLNRLYSD